AAPAEQHRTGAALAVIAALLGAGEPEMLAQCVEQRCARVEGDAMLTAVDVEHHGHGRTRIAPLGPSIGRRVAGCAGEGRRRGGGDAGHEKMPPAGAGAWNGAIGHETSTTSNDG